MEEYNLTDIQFKYELRKQLTDLKQKLALLESKEYEKIRQIYLQEISDIEISLQD